MHRCIHENKMPSIQFSISNVGHITDCLNLNFSVFKAVSA